MPRSRKVLLTAALSAVPFLLAAQTSAPRDWTTWGYDQERTGWNRGETTLSKDNVSKLGLKWSSKIGTQPTDIALSTMTAPLVVEGVTVAGTPRSLVVVVGSDNTVYTMDADTGSILWQKPFPNTLKPKLAANWLCPNTQNATPVIDKEKGILYVNTSDGKLRALDIATGADKMPPIDFTEPFARNWSLNLIDNVIYTPSARGCGNVSANFAAVDLSDPSHPQTYYHYASEGRPGGAWGRGGVVRGPRGIYTQTADGAYDPASGLLGESVIALTFKTMHLLDSFTPPNWQELNDHDLDLGSAGPVVFPYGGKTLVASIAKEGVLYLLDAKALGGGATQRGGPAQHDKALYTSPTLGNDDKVLAGRGIWGTIATSEDPQGGRWLYVPMWGPPSKNAPAFPNAYGDAPEGSIMAFQVTGDAAKPTLVAKWRSTDMHVPDPPVVANGVVYAIQTGENTAQGGGGGGGGRGRGAAGAPGAPGAQAGPGRGAAGPGRGGAGAAEGAPAAGVGRGGGGRGNPETAAKARATPITNLKLFAFDAQTGKTLYSSDKLISSWVHFSEPVVALGKVFVVTWDGHVYAFGLN